MVPDERALQALAAAALAASNHVRRLPHVMLEGSCAARQSRDCVGEDCHVMQLSPTPYTNKVKTEVIISENRW